MNTENENNIIKDEIIEKSNQINLASIRNEFLKEIKKLKNDTEKQFKDQNTKTLGDVFELNIRKINMCALLLIFILYYRLFSYVFLSIFALSRNFLQSKFRRLFIFFSIIYTAIIYSITYIILFEFITFISIVYNFFSGDINNFIKFLSCKNVNYDGFDRFRIVEEIKSDFIMYFILKIIHIIFDILTLPLRVSQT